MANLNDGTVDQVSKTKTQTGRIYGWMWESAQSGAFDAVEAAAEKANAMLQALRNAKVEAELAAEGFKPED